MVPDPAPRRLESGRVHVELSLLLALAGIGAALGAPQVVRLTRHEALATSDWVWLSVGAVLFLLGAGPLVWAFSSVLLEGLRKRKS